MNKVNYFEIGTTDPEGAKAFYGSLFDWQFGEPSAANYRMINQSEGGLWNTSKIGGQSWAIFYVHVDDVAAAIKKAEELGAKVALPLTDNGAITFAHLIDPHGNRFGVWKPKT